MYAQSFPMQHMGEVILIAALIRKDTVSTGGPHLEPFFHIIEVEQAARQPGDDPNPFHCAKAGNRHGVERDTMLCEDRLLAS